MFFALFMGPVTLYIFNHISGQGILHMHMVHFGTCLEHSLNCSTLHAFDKAFRLDCHIEANEDT